jgi:hypothetical protein
LVAKARGRYDEARDLISKSIEFNPSPCFIVCATRRHPDQAWKTDGRPGSYPLRDPRESEGYVHRLLYIFAGTASLNFITRARRPTGSAGPSPSSRAIPRPTNIWLRPMP